MADSPSYAYSHLLEFTRKVFESIGCSSQHASLAAESLLAADLRGVDSHGVARLSGYVRLWEAGRVKADPDITVVHETPSTAVVDGDSGLGLVVARKAMEIAIAKAEQVGTGWVSVRNSNHFGIAAVHAMMALEKDMLGMAMTNASPLVAPTFSIDRMLGTNPICVVSPAGEEPQGDDKATAVTFADGTHFEFRASNHTEKSGAGLTPSANISPWPLTVDTLTVSANAHPAPIRHYATTDDLLQAWRPCRLTWHLSPLPTTRDPS